jgi:hypothetical protein
MRGSASTFGRQMASFVRSSNWRCTYTGAAKCVRALPLLARAGVRAAPALLVACARASGAAAVLPAWLQPL